MTNLWKGLISLSVMGAVILYFTLQDKEETKVDIRIDKMEQKVDEKEFDADFSDFNGEANSKIKKQRAEVIDSIKSEIATAKRRLNDLDEFSTEILDSGKEALIEEDARLSMTPEEFQKLNKRGVK